MNRETLKRAAEIARTNPKLAYEMVLAVDEHAVEELRLYMENESKLNNQKMSIIKNIQRKMKGGKYDANLAPKLWMYWVDEGAKAYVKEFGGDVKTTFPKPVREALAKELAKDYEAAIKGGEYGKVASDKTAALGDADKKVIDAFTSEKAAEGKLLSSDGKKLEKLGMGGGVFAQWKGGKIVVDDSRPHVKNDEEILRALKKATPAKLLAPHPFFGKSAAEESETYRLAARVAATDPELAYWLIED